MPPVLDLLCMDLDNVRGGAALLISAELAEAIIGIAALSIAPIALPAPFLPPPPPNCSIDAS